MVFLLAFHVVFKQSGNPRLPTLSASANSPPLLLSPTEGRNQGQSLEPGQHGPRRGSLLGQQLANLQYNSSCARGRGRDAALPQDAQPLGPSLMQPGRRTLRVPRLTPGRPR